MAAALLTACATAAPSAPVTAPTTPTSPTAPPSSRAAQMLSAAGRQNAPTQAEIERVLGHADIARQDGAGSAWTYRLDSCALLLLFTSDAHNTLRLSEAHPSARRTGEATPSLDQCATEASARHH